MTNSDSGHGAGPAKVKVPDLKIPRIIQEKIIDKVDTNRITIVVGGTGCGKSTLVPQLLLQHFGSPVLCTQPRRLAVVAVSTHVAQQRGTTLGGRDVGYHIGQTRVATNDTCLLFCSAGILLEELRANGIDALTKYKVILIDECHERSSESDLCLTIIKMLMIAHPSAYIRVVLMSATFNHGRYAKYFDNVPQCDYIDAITLETGGTVREFYSNVNTYYLSDIFKMIPDHFVKPFLTPEFLQFKQTMKRDPDSELVGDDGGKTLSNSLLILIMLLVITLHKEEPKEAIFLIFAPTYVQLEQIYQQLSEVHTILQPLIHVLHSSIDMEHCLKSMNSPSSSGYGGSNVYSKRRILLASAIADSSVTIPGVTCVIDTCRMLEVKWNAKDEIHVPKTVWASKSICDQRRGRTGRTCKGRVYRLLDQSFYINGLEAWDQPQIQLASTRDEVLSLLSTNNKVLSDPHRLLSKCMDPPPNISIEKAIAYLKKIGACTEIKLSNSRQKLVPTDTGQLLATLPSTVSEGNMIKRGAQNGLLHEAVALVTIMSTRPMPILHVFGDIYANEASLRRYYPEVEPKDPKSKILANLAAYLFWYKHWNVGIRENGARHRFQQCTCLSADLMSDGFSSHQYNLYSGRITQNELGNHDCNVFAWSEEVDEAHISWCKRHYINPTSVRAISTSIDVIMGILYKKEHDQNEWLRYQKGYPEWDHWIASTRIDSNEFHNGGTYDIFGMIYGMGKKKTICRLMTSLLDSRSQSTDNAGSLLQLIPATVETTTNMQRMACVHFLRGNCIFGNKCKNAHSYTAPRPLCRFYPACTKSDCIYSHAPPAQSISTMHITNKSESIVFPPYEGGPLTWYRNVASTLLLFGEADFGFTKALHSLGIRPFLSTTYDSTAPSSATRYCNACDVDATRWHIDRRLLNKHLTALAWNFPFTGKDEDDTVHETLLSGAFLSASQYVSTKKLTMGSNSKFQFGIALQGDQFSRWSVHKVARRCGFFLAYFNQFEREEFPGYSPKRSNCEPFPAQDSRFYIFQSW